MKKSIYLIFTLFLTFGFLQCANAKDSYQIAQYQNPYFAYDTKYDYLYANPPKQSLYTSGRYIMSTSKVRYVHSPSRLKGIKHAARINAYNYANY